MAGQLGRSKGLVSTWERGEVWINLRTVDERRQIDHGHAPDDVEVHAAPGPETVTQHRGVRLHSVGL